MSLLDAGVDVNVPTLIKTTDTIQRSLMGTPFCRYPIEFACAVSTLEIVQLLLDRGAKLKGTNALHSAVGIGSAHFEEDSEERLEIVKLLLGKGMDINAIEFDNDKQFAKHYWKRTYGTPLHYAAAAGWAEGVKLLMERGADTTVLGYVYHTDQRWGTALDWQKLNDVDEGYYSSRVLELLKEKENVDGQSIHQNDCGI